jgi:hypothetical protein
MVRIDCGWLDGGRKGGRQEKREGGRDRAGHNICGGSGRESGTRSFGEGEWIQASSSIVNMLVGVVCVARASLFQKLILLLPAHSGLPPDVPGKELR